MAKPTLAQCFGKVLQKHRKAKGFSQEELAEKAQVHPTHIGLIERGLRNPSLNVAGAIATALGAQLSDLITQAEKRNKGLDL